MSALFKITIVAVAGPTVRARFEVDHPDQWNVPSSAHIALCTVVEAFENMNQGWGFHGQDKQPLGERQAKVLVDGHPHRAKLEYWRDLAYGKKVEITKAEHQRLREKGGASLSSDGGGYYQNYEPQWAQFSVEAQAAIVEVHLEDEVGNPKQKDDDPDPKATLVFTVAEPGYLYHMVEGFHFASAMYEPCAT